MLLVLVFSLGQGKPRGKGREKNFFEPLKLGGFLWRPTKYARMGQF